MELSCNGEMWLGPQMPTSQALREHRAAAVGPKGSLLEGDQTSAPTDTLLEMKGDAIAVPFYGSSSLGKVQAPAYPNRLEEDFQSPACFVISSPNSKT